MCVLLQGRATERATLGSLLQCLILCKIKMLKYKTPIERGSVSVQFANLSPVLHQMTIRDHWFGRQVKIQVYTAWKLLLSFPVPPDMAQGAAPLPVQVKCWSSHYRGSESFLYFCCKKLLCAVQCI